MTTKTTAELLADLREKLELAKEPGGEKAVAKREKRGIPSARARIHARSGANVWRGTFYLALPPTACERCDPKGRGRTGSHRARGVPSAGRMSALSQIAVLRSVD